MKPRDTSSVCRGCWRRWAAGLDPATLDESSESVYVAEFLSLFVAHDHGLAAELDPHGPVQPDLVVVPTILVGDDFAWVLGELGRTETTEDLTHLNAPFSEAYGAISPSKCVARCATPSVPYLGTFIISNYYRIAIGVISM